MLIRSLSVVTEFLDALSDSLTSVKPAAQLTTIQKTMLGVMIVGVIIAETLNWAAFERRSLGKFKSTRLCWIFYSAKIAWNFLLEASIRNILSHYDINGGALILTMQARKDRKERPGLQALTRSKIKPLVAGPSHLALTSNNTLK